MKVKELIEKLKNCDPELEVNTYNSNSDDPTNYWVVDIEECSKGSSGYPNEGEVILITSE
jgi:hypothetical protein